MYHLFKKILLLIYVILFAVDVDLVGSACHEALCFIHKRDTWFILYCWYAIWQLLFLSTWMNFSSTSMHISLTLPMHIIQLHAWTCLTGYLKLDNYDIMLNVSILQAPLWEQKTSQYSLLEDIFHIHHTTCNRILYIAELKSNVAVEYTSFIRSIAIHNVAKQDLNHELHQVHQHKWIDDCKSIYLSLFFFVIISMANFIHQDFWHLTSVNTTPV